MLCAANGKTRGVEEGLFIEARSLYLIWTRSLFRGIVLMLNTSMCAAPIPKLDDELSIAH